MTNKEQEVSFETAFEQLEQIVADLERGNLDLSASLASYERGVGLLGRCQTLLDGVDRAVALLTGVEADGTPVTTPFDASATAVMTIVAEAPKAKSKAVAKKASTPPVLLPPAQTAFEDIDPPF